jgi:sugar-specific transcriptional regulator TrmB
MLKPRQYKALKAQHNVVKSRRELIQKDLKELKSQIEEYEKQLLDLDEEEELFIAKGGVAALLKEYEDAHGK